MKFKYLKDEVFFTLNGKIKQAKGGFYETNDKEEIEQLRKSKEFKEAKGVKDEPIKK